MTAPRNIDCLRVEIDRITHLHSEVAPVSLSCRMLLRILDERDSLLASLREMALDNRPGGGAINRARAALAKAEEPV